MNITDLCWPQFLFCASSHTISTLNCLLHVEWPEALPCHCRWSPDGRHGQGGPEGLFLRCLTLCILRGWAVQKQDIRRDAVPKQTSPAWSGSEFYCWDILLQLQFYRLLDFGQLWEVHTAINFIAGGWCRGFWKQVPLPTLPLLTPQLLHYRNWGELRLTQAVIQTIDHKSLWRS